MADLERSDRGSRGRFIGNMGKLFVALETIPFAVAAACGPISDKNPVTLLGEATTFIQDQTNLVRQADPRSITEILSDPNTLPKVRRSLSYYSESQAFSLVALREPSVGLYPTKAEDSDSFWDFLIRHRSTSGSFQFDKYALVETHGESPNLSFIPREQNVEPYTIIYPYAALMDAIYEVGGTDKSQWELLSLKLIDRGKGLVIRLKD